ncbi:MAG: RidA family protein [Parvibaculum sp.]|uniref:RidA family protein n=1 Tax=Parvibaculum sp. TaxID=2024848 RepID=UPI003C7617DC
MTIRRIGIGKRLSEAVVHGDRVYLAGQVAEDASQPIRGQAEQILGQIDALLAEAGTDKSKLLFAQIWLADMNDFAAFNEVWDTWIDPANPPARACVQSPLVKPEWKAEVQVTAAI